MLTSATPARASVRAAAGVATVTGDTPALPPPWIVGWSAPGRSRASSLIPVVDCPVDSGSTWRSLRSSTNDAAATVRSRSGAISSGAGAAASGPVGVSR